MLRIEGPTTGPCCFRDDTGPVLPVVAHHGDATAHELVYGEWDEIAAIESEIAAAGYDGVRRFEVLPAGDFWISRSGRDLRCAPDLTPNYWRNMERSIRGTFSRGLRRQFSISGLDASMQSREARRAYVRDLARVCMSVGPEAFIAVEVNEPQGIGARTPDEVNDFMDLFRQLTEGKILTFNGSPYEWQGEDTESKTAQDAWAVGAKGNQMHSYRGGNDIDMLRHILQYPYELGARLWLYLYSERPGMGDPVSVGQVKHAEISGALDAAGALARGLPTFFCGRPGIFSQHMDGRWARYADVPGFLTAARLVKRIQAFGADMHLWERRTHVNESQGDRRVLDLTDNPDGIRLDQVISVRRRKAVSILYGINDGTRGLVEDSPSLADWERLSNPNRSAWDKYSTREEEEAAMAAPQALVSDDPAFVAGGIAHRVRSLVGGRTTVISPLDPRKDADTTFTQEASVAFERVRVLLTEW